MGMEGFLVYFKTDEILSEEPLKGMIVDKIRYKYDGVAIDAYMVESCEQDSYEEYFIVLPQDIMKRVE